MQCIIFEGYDIDRNVDYIVFGVGVDDVVQWWYVCVVVVVVYDDVVLVD